MVLIIKKKTKRKLRRAVTLPSLPPEVLSLVFTQLVNLHRDDKAEAREAERRLQPGWNNLEESVADFDGDASIVLPCVSVCRAWQEVRGRCAESDMDTHGCSLP